MSTLHPDNKIAYHEGDRVEVALSGDVDRVVKATVCGIASAHIIDHWIVRLDEPIGTWEFSCISVQHTFIRPLGDNRPFLCEGRSRVMT